MPGSSQFQTILVFFEASYPGERASPRSRNDGPLGALLQAIHPSQPGQMKAGFCSQGIVVAFECEFYPIHVRHDDIAE